MVENKKIVEPNDRLHIMCHFNGTKQKQKTHSGKKAIWFFFHWHRWSTYISYYALLYAICV